MSNPFHSSIEFQSDINSTISKNLSNDDQPDLLSSLASRANQQQQSLLPSLVNDQSGSNQMNASIHQGVGIKHFLKDEERRRALLQPRLQQSQQLPSSSSSSKPNLSLSPPRRGSSSSSGGSTSGNGSHGYGSQQLSTPIEETFSPAMSDSTSTDTEDSVGDIEPLHPLTPITTNGFNQSATPSSSAPSPSSWIPRELNLVRKKSSFQNLSSPLITSSPIVHNSSNATSSSFSLLNEEEREKQIQKDRLAEMEREKERERSRLGSERVALAVGLGISSSSRTEEGGKRQLRSGGKKELRLVGAPAAASTSRGESPILGESQSPLSTSLNSSNPRSPSPFSNASSFTYGRSSPQQSKTPRSPMPINPSRPTFATPRNQGHKSTDSNSNSNGARSSSNPSPNPTSDKRRRSSSSHSRKRSSTSFHSKAMATEGHHPGRLPSPSQSPHDPMPSPSGSVASLSSSQSGHLHQLNSSSNTAPNAKVRRESPRNEPTSLPSPGGFSEARKKNKKAVPKLPPMPLVLDSKSGPTFTISSEQSPSSAGHASARARSEDPVQPPSTSCRTSKALQNSSNASTPSTASSSTNLNPLSALLPAPPIQDDYHSFLATSPASSHFKISSNSNSRYSASMKLERHLSATSFVSAVSIPASGFHTPTFNPNGNETMDSSPSTLNATLGSELGETREKSKTLEDEPPATAFFDFEEAEATEEAAEEKKQIKEEEENRIPLLFRTGSSRPTLKVEKDEKAMREEKKEFEQLEPERMEEALKVEEEKKKSEKMETNSDALSVVDTLEEPSNRKSSSSRSSSSQSHQDHSAFEFESSPPPPQIQNASLVSQVKIEKLSQSPPSLSSYMNLPPPLISTTSATSDPSSEYSMDSAPDYGLSRGKEIEKDQDKLERRAKEEEEASAEAMVEAMKIVGESPRESKEAVPLFSSPEEMRPTVLPPTSLPQPIPGTQNKSEVHFRTSIFGAPAVSASPTSDSIDPRSREGSLTTSALPQISIRSTSPKPVVSPRPSGSFGKGSIDSSSTSSRNGSLTTSTRAGTGGSITSAATSSLSNHGLKINVADSGFMSQGPLSPGIPSPHYRSTPLSQRDFSKATSNEMGPPSRNDSYSTLQTPDGRPRSQSQVSAALSPPIRAAMMSPGGQPDSGLSSRWSSGSESDGETSARRRRSSSVSGKRPSKEKHLSTSSKNQGGGSSAYSTKAFFSGLNLRKKSLPLGSDYPVPGSAQSSAPSSWAGTPLTTGAPSPMLGGPGTEGENGEWPFPVSTSSSVASTPALPRSSHELSTPARSPSQTQTAAQTTRGRSGSFADRFSQMAQSKIRAGSLKSKASDISLSSSVISQAQDSVPSLPATSPSSHERQRSLVGLGISDVPVHPSLSIRSDSSSRTSVSRERTISSPTEAPARPARPDEKTMPSALPPSGLRAARALHAAKQQQPGEGKQIRKSATVSDLQRAVRLSHASKASLSNAAFKSEFSLEARKEAKEREDAQARARESSEVNNAHASTSSDQTPRVSYISLPTSPTSPTGPPIPSRYLSPEDQDGLAEVGKNMFSGIWADLANGSQPDTPSSEKHRSDFSFTDAANGLLTDEEKTIKFVPRRIAKAKKAMRIKKHQLKVRHRTSLTDLGKSWIDAHPDEEIEAAITTASSSGPSGEYYSNNASLNDDSSDDGTDDYGSSDGRGGGRSNDEQSGSGAGGSGSGGSGGNDGWDPSNRSDSRANGDDDEDTDTEDSEDDTDDIYGTPDPLSSSGQSRRPPGPSKLATTAITGNETDSSDDVPLGQKVSDAAVLQKSLRDRERKEQISKTASALERNSINGSSKRPQNHRLNSRFAPRTNADVNGGYNLDAADLIARLLKVQARMNGQGEAQSGSSRQHSSRSRRPAVAPPVQTAAVSPTAQQGSLSRARSLNTGGRGGRAGAANLPPPLPTGGLAMIPNLSAGPLSPPLPQMPGFISQAQNPSASHQLPAPQRSATLPSQSSQPPPMPGMLSSGMPGHHASTRSGSPLLPNHLGRGQPSSAPLEPATAPVPPLRNNGMPSSPAMQDLVSAVDNVSIQQQPRARSRSISRARVLPSINANVAPPMPELAHPRLVSSPPLGSSSGSLASPPPGGLPSVQSLAGAASQSEDVPLNSGEVSAVRRTSSTRKAEPLSRLAEVQGGSQSHSPLGPPSQRIQHRVYVVTKQRYGTAEVTTGARARDLVLDIMDKEYVPQDGKGGGWVVFDVCSELGLERPIREYEIVSEIAEARATPEDYFILKRTELAPYLSIRSVPSISPTLAGWAYIQESKGKWAKRWLELRDHQLFHAKNEKGKNETLICHLSGFDAYLVDVQKIKAPKAHAFALRSQHSITMFEKPDQDYVHYFSLSDPNAHRSWVRALLNARTYILRQEYSALFKPPEGLTRSRADTVREAEGGASSGDSGRNSSEMARSAPRRLVSPPASSDPTLVAAIHQQQQQQLQAQQQQAQSSARSTASHSLIPRDAFAGPFEKGSLLASQAMKAAPPSIAQGRPSSPTNPNDFSTHQRTRDRIMEEQRRADLRERSQRAREQGTHLAELAGRRF